MFLHHSPFWLKAFFPGFIWRIPTRERKIYLTFDDGPIPDVTEFVIDTLNQFKAKATFFCIGNNVEKHPDIFRQLIDNEHSIGNHTFNHMNGWKTEDAVYLDNIKQCEAQLNVQTNLFRPPYGRIKKTQSRVVRKEREIVMWDVLSGDFSKEITREICLKKSIRYARPGSIVLFHDSVKAAPNMQYALPRFLEHFSNEDYTFEAMAMK